MIKGSAKRKYDLPDFEALLKDAKNGSEPALLKFLQCFEGLAVKLSRQSVCTDRLGEDALQIANLGILKAGRKATIFTGSRLLSLIKYVRSCIQRSDGSSR